MDGPYKMDGPYTAEREHDSGWTTRDHEMKRNPVPSAIVRGLMCGRLRKIPIG